MVERSRWAGVVVVAGGRRRGRGSRWSSRVVIGLLGVRGDGPIRPIARKGVLDLRRSRSVRIATGVGRPPGSVGRRVARGRCGRAWCGVRAPGVEAGPVGRQAPPGGPGRSRSTDSPAVTATGTMFRGRLDQRDVEQGRQPAARPDLGGRPVAVLRAGAGPGRGRTAARYIRQIASFSAGPGRSRKNVRVEPLAPRELRREPRDVVGRADHERVARPVVEPGQQRPEEPGRDARVARRPRASRPAPSRPRRS